jgi:hypothetical protein
MAIVALLAVITAGIKSLVPRPPIPIPEGARLLIPARVGMSTLVGFTPTAPPPWQHGNCFELLHGDQGREPCSRGMHVINMQLENFREIVKRLKMTNVEVEHVGGEFLVVDARIPRRWLRERPCSGCSRISKAKLAKYANRFGEPSLKP